MRGQARVGELEAQLARQQILLAVLEQRVRRLEGGSPPPGSHEAVPPLLQLSSAVCPQPAEPDGTEQHCQKLFTFDLERLQLTDCPAVCARFHECGFTNCQQGESCTTAADTGLKATCYGWAFSAASQFKIK